MARKSYAGAASATKLVASITSNSTTLSVDNAAGYPAGGNPFVIVVGRGTAAEEKILIASVTGTTFTVASSGRGYDSTIAQAHAANETVEHCIDAGTIDEANAHVNDTARDDHTQYLTNGRHDTTTRHTFGGAFPAPSTPPAVTTAGSAGSAAGPARSDHTHAIAAGAINSSGMFGAGVVTIGGALSAPSAPANVGTAAATGSSTAAARADHVHALDPALAGSGLTSFAGALLVNVDGTTVHVNGSNQLEVVPNSGTVSDGSITTAKLAAGAVTTAKIATANVTPALLAASLPRGRVDIGTKTTSQSGITAETTIASLNATGTPVSATRYWRITAFCQAISGTVGDEQAIVRIKRDGTTVGLGFVKTGNAAHIVAEDDGMSAGSHTYTVTLQRNSGTGTLSWDAAANGPTWICIEDIGGA